MSLSSKLRERPSTTLNPTPALTPETTKRTLSQLQVVQEKLAQSNAVIDDDSLELELPVISGISKDEDEIKYEQENFDYILFISDYKLTDAICKKLDKFLNIHGFEEETFKNRDFSYLKEHDVKYIWIDLNQSGAREWVRKHIKHNKEYKVITTYQTKGSKWVLDLEPYTTFSCSKKKIGDASYLTLGELMDDIQSATLKISKPVGNCLERLLYKNRLVRDQKN